MTLRALARRHGIETRYGDRPVPDETLRLLLGRLGVTGEAGPACHLPAWLHEAPAWGVFCQLYELRPAAGRPDWGIGDLADLADLAAVLGAAGADFLGINPVHALFLGEPGRRSPFSPSDRRFLNPIYIAPDRLPAPRAGAGAPPGELIDHDAVVRAKLPALRASHAEAPFGDGAWSEAAHDAFLADGGEPLRRHALFEALSLHMAEQGHGAGWSGWPEPHRDAKSPEVAAFARGAEIGFHLWLQWAASVQLGLAAEAAREAGMRIGLYLDLAVGEAPDGAAAWGSDVVMEGLTVGAPPDVFAAEGQDWGLAAPNPVALAEDPAPFRDMIAAQMRHAGALRIDHAMALRQLFLIPEGEGPAAGAHVRYPMDTLIEVLSEESRACEAVVIGEDLGFVPEGFRDAMEDFDVLSYRILYFEQDGRAFRAPDTWPAKALACVSTHDLPTLAGWWEAEDVALRREHGLVSEADTPDHEAQRGRERRAMLRLLRAERLGRRGWKAEGPLPEGMLVAVHRILARTPCLLAGVRLSDLVGPERPTNLPGTLDSYPNWRPRAPLPVDRIAEEPAFRAVTEAMAEERPR
jgi:4-alpha-glucanotransferase